MQTDMLLTTESVAPFFVTSFEHPLYKPFLDLYRESFPLFEQRTAEQQLRAFQSDAYKLLVFTVGDSFLGFIAYWEFDDYCYVEHFAVNSTLRGKGIGSGLLKTFIRSISKTVLLEIDPITDPVSEVRLKFYKRCGFFENPYPHRHPAYCGEYQPHPLIVLTTNREITAEEYQRFALDLCETVMAR